VGYHDAAPRASGVPGEPIAFSTRFSDPGGRRWSATIDYGDGTVEQRKRVDPSLSFDHAYAAVGSYALRVTISDGEGGIATTERQVDVHPLDVRRDAADPSRFILVAGGTTGADRFAVKRYESGTFELWVNGVSVGTFLPVASVVLYGGAGDDVATVLSQPSVPLAFYGGAGDDVLFSASGDDLLVGGLGRDRVFGGAGLIQ